MFIRYLLISITAVTFAATLAAVPPALGVEINGPSVTGTTVVVAQRGDAAPESDNHIVGIDVSAVNDAKRASYESFDAPVLNDAGQVVFTATVSGDGVKSANTQGIYRVDGSAPPTQIARAFQAVGSEPGNFTDFEGEVLLNAAGDVVFYARLGGKAKNSNDSWDARGIYRGDGTGAPTRICRENLAPRDGLHNLRSISADFSVNSGTKVTFVADVGSSDLNTKSERGIYIGDGSAAPKAIVRVGQTPATGIGKFTNLGSLSLNDAGQVAFSASLNGRDFDYATTNAIYRVDDSAAPLEIVRGAQTPKVGPGKFLDFYELALNETGQVVFLAKLGGVGVDDSNDLGLYRGDGSAGPTQIARRGSAPAHGMGTFTDLGSGDFNAAGQSVFLACLGGRGVTEQNDYGIYRGDGSAAPTPIAREGQAAPTTDGASKGVFMNMPYSALAINDFGHVAFSGFIDCQIEEVEWGSGLFFFHDELGLISIARSGDEFLGSTLRSVLFSGAGLNNRDQITYSYYLTDGRSGVAVWTAP